MSSMILISRLYVYVSLPSDVGDIRIWSSCHGCVASSALTLGSLRGYVDIDQSLP